MMDNYPPGVDGSEYMIAGPDREFTDIRPCLSCGRVEEVDVTGYGWEEWWTCPREECRAENARVNEPDFPDLPADIPNWWEA